ncbi:hypothetical protein ES705_49234 [subsurface metagenome]
MTSIWINLLVIPPFLSLTKNSDHTVSTVWLEQKLEVTEANVPLVVKLLDFYMVRR